MEPAPALPGKAPRRLALALQGGGAHGAFTWGVLDALLDEPRIEVAALTGASAGAFNAAAVAEGLARGGREGAKASLARAWGVMSAVRAFSPAQATVPNKLGYASLDVSPAYWAYDLVARVLSPYEFNPLDVNELRATLRGLFDYPALRGPGIPLHVGATDVLTGRSRLFPRSAITPEVLAASACLPGVFQAQGIAGRDYWDGGYSGDPPLEPLTGADRACDDVLIVRLTPVRRTRTPRGRRDVEKRVDEVAFNMNLLRQVEGLRALAALADAGELNPRHRPPRLHGIDGDATLEPLSYSSKLNAEWPFLTRLREAGAAAGRAWIAANFDALGVRDTLDLPPPVV